MKIPIAVPCCLLLIAGCREWEMRKEPDLWRVDPHEEQRLRHNSHSSQYVPQVTDPSVWQIHTSLDNRQALQDGDPATFATSGATCHRGANVLIDLGELCCFQRVAQVHLPDRGAPPRFRVDTAGKHGFPFVLQSVGSGEPGATHATFPAPVRARFIRITVLEDSSDAWVISELQID